MTQGVWQATAAGLRPPHQARSAGHERKARSWLLAWGCGLLMGLPQLAQAQQLAGAPLCAALGFLGWMGFAAPWCHSGPLRLALLARSALSLALWQVLGQGWALAALPPLPAGGVWATALLGLLLLTLNLGPLLIGLAMLRQVVRRLIPARPTLGASLALMLAWAAWAGLREAALWGGDYGSLALGGLEWPWMRWTLPTLGSALSEGLSLGLAGLLGASLAAGLQGNARAGRALVAAGLALGVLTVLPTPQWTTPEGATLQVLAVQAPRDARPWDLAQRDAALAQLHDALRTAPTPAVLVSSETFLREPAPAPQQAQERWRELLEAVQQQPATLLLGLPLRLRSEDGIGLGNGALLLSPGAYLGTGTAYAKQRLAPVGETLPVWVQQLLSRWFVLKERGGILAAPPHMAEPLWAAGTVLGVSICHELAFSSALRASAAQSTWLVNLADDSWLPSPSYRLQVQRLARLRALEWGKPLLRVSQDQASLLVSAGGEVLAQAPHGGRLNWAVAVQPHSGSTPYARLGAGATFAGAALAAGLLALFTALAGRRPNRSESVA